MKKLTIILLAVVGFLGCIGSKKTTSNNLPNRNLDTLVIIHTSYGTMKVKLYNETPLHRSNFIKLAGSHFYDSTLFHRVIRNFMIQGGDPQSKTAVPGQMLGNGDIGYMIPAEFRDTIYHKKGALCAARTENPAKASSGCQFYIVQGQVFSPIQLNTVEMQRGMRFTEKQKQLYTTVGGSPWLDGSYTVFGEVVDGLDVIDRIAAVTTQPGDRPVEDVRMTMDLEIVSR